jgi:hypothetical protein
MADAVEYFEATLRETLTKAIGVIHNTHTMNHTDAVPSLPLVANPRAVHSACAGYADTALHLQVVSNSRRKSDRNR